MIKRDKLIEAVTRTLRAWEDIAEAVRLTADDVAADVIDAVESDIRADERMTAYADGYASSTYDNNDRAARVREDLLRDLRRKVQENRDHAYKLNTNRDRAYKLNKDSPFTNGMVYGYIMACDSFIEILEGR